MTVFRSYFVILILFVLGGCVATPQQPIPLAEGALLEGQSRVGILLNPMPKVETVYPGAGCLLCLAAASAANSSLSKHVSTLSSEDIKSITSELKEQIELFGHTVTVINEPIQISKLPKVKSKDLNKARFDFSGLKKSHQIERLIVVDLTFIGVQRNYSSYVPTGAPQATIQGAAYLVDLNSNTYMWYQPLQIFRSAEGEWDEPPVFPGITNAFYQALEQARDAIATPFKVAKTTADL